MRFISSLVINFLFYEAQPIVNRGLYIIEASRSHSDTPHSVVLLWKCDHSDAETSA